LRGGACAAAVEGSAQMAMNANVKPQVRKNCKAVGAHNACGSIDRLEAAGAAEIAFDIDSAPVHA